MTVPSFPIPSATHLQGIGLPETEVVPRFVAEGDGPPECIAEQFADACEGQGDGCRVTLLCGTDLDRGSCDTDQNSLINTMIRFECTGSSNASPDHACSSAEAWTGEACETCADGESSQSLW